MTDTLRDILLKKDKQKYATDAGNNMHAKLQRIIISDNQIRGDKNLIDKIKSRQNLIQYFGENARTEVPIAGKINGKFISRRIDRLIEDSSIKTITFIDYKTDTNKNIFHDKYMRQMAEYGELLGKVYPGHKVIGLILWTNDFTIENIY